MPSPAIARPTMKVVESWATPQMSEPISKIVKAATNVYLTRSASRGVRRAVGNRWM